MVLQLFSGISLGRVPSRRFQGDSLESQAIAKIANAVSEIANAMPAKGYAIVISIPLTQSRVLLVGVAIALSTITPSCI